MKRYLLVIMVIVLMVCLLVGCGKEEKKPVNEKTATEKFYVEQNGRPKSFDIDLGNGLHITSAVTVSGNKGVYLTEKEYMTLIENPLWRMGGDAVVGADFVVDTYEQYYDIEKIKRLIPLFDEGAMIYAPESIKFYSDIIDKGGLKITGEMLVDMDKALAVGYDLINQSQTMVTTDDPDTGFVISPKYKYAATAFIPKLAQVKGAFAGAGNEYNTVKVLYPCILENGYMDGIYVVIQSDSTDGFPELG